MKLEDCWWLDYENCLQDLRDRKRLTKAEHLVLDATFAAYFLAFGPSYDVQIIPRFLINTSKQKALGNYKLKSCVFDFFQVFSMPEKYRATFRCEISIGHEKQFYSPYYNSYFFLSKINQKTTSICFSREPALLSLMHENTKQQYENKHGPITYPKSEK